MNKYRDLVAAYFKARPNVWIDGRSLQTVGGSYAWRSRVSDCRLDLGMVIENRLRRIEHGPTVSEYRYVPEVEDETPILRGHDMNDWGLQ